jgi:hypothetical protein
MRDAGKGELPTQSRRPTWFWGDATTHCRKIGSYPGDETVVCCLPDFEDEFRVERSVALVVEDGRIRSTSHAVVPKTWSIEVSDLFALVPY